jgi:hypothetical protein
VEFSFLPRWDCHQRRRIHADDDLNIEDAESAKAPFE